MKPLMKAIMISLGFLVAGAAVWGTGSSEQQGTQGAQTLSFSVTTVSFGQEPTGTPVQEAWLKKMSEMMGMPLDIKFQYIHRQDYEEKLRIMVASNNLPDLLTNWGLKQSELISYGESGMFVDLAKHMNQLPNYKKALAAAPGSLANLYSAKKELFGYYFISYNIQKTDGGNDIAHSVGIRQDIFDKNKIKIPTTIDELYQAAKQLKAIYPDKYPLMQMEEWQNPINLFYAANHVGESRFYNGMAYAYGPLQQGYKDALVEMNRWYADGLISPDYFTQTQADGNAAMAAGSAMIIPAMWYGYPGYWESQYPEQKWTMVVGIKNPDYGSPWDFTKVTKDDVSIINAWSIMLNAKTKAPQEKLLKFLDLQQSQEATDLFSWGILGDTYTVTNGIHHYTPKVLSASDPGDVLNGYGAGTGTCRAGIFPQPQDYSVQLETTPSQGNWVNGKTVRARCIDIKRDYYVDAESVPESKISLAPLSKEETDRYANIMTPIDTYAKSQASLFIMGKRPFSQWEQFQSELKAMGDIQAAMDIYNSKIVR